MYQNVTHISLKIPMQYSNKEVLVFFEDKKQAWEILKN